MGVLAVVLLLICSCRGDDDGVTTERSVDNLADYHPSRRLQVSELGDYLTPEGKEILKGEYPTIKGGQRMPWNEAQKPENLKKNRYDDVLAFDWSRVHLVTSSDDESDYINTNYINGTNREKEYISTQGPLNNTIIDFWNMVWYQNATKIVMLANLMEKNKSKVDKYWPEETSSYGPFTVEKISQFSLPDSIVIRTFSFRKEGIPITRIIRHFHYTAWPDLTVPDQTLPIITLMHLVRGDFMDNTVPIIIHCSAGIGRTGTVVLMDSMMQLASKEGIVDFPQRLDHMRVQRVDVVETQDQYVFAHQAVHDRFSSEIIEDILADVLHQFRNKVEDGMNSNSNIAS